MEKRTSLSTMELLKHLNIKDDECVKLEGELLKDYQKVLLSIAEDIISICEEENIYYQLSGGSALGAVRHKGFIPWDDDFDINILGIQQDKFAEVFAQKYPGKYTVQTYRTDNYGLQMAKVRLNGSVARSHLDPIDDECGISIDIFVLENVFDNPIARKLHGYLCMASGLFLSCRNYYKNRKQLKRITEGDPNAYKAIRIKVGIGWLFSFMSVRRMAVLTHAIYSMCKNNNSEYISIPGGRKHYFGEMYKRSGMQETIKKTFEEHEWNVAKDYDSYFKVLYGPDYMTPPPEDKREEHIYLEFKLPGDLKK